MECVYLGGKVEDRRANKLEENKRVEEREEAETVRKIKLNMKVSYKRGRKRREETWKKIYLSIIYLLTKMFIYQFIRLDK